MGMVMIQKCYEDLISSDIEWLKKQANTLERDHIMRVLEWAVRYEYEFIKPLSPNEE